MKSKSSEISFVFSSESSGIGWVTLANEIDSSMKLLPYVDDKFVGYRNKSVQDFRFALSEGIRSQVFFATFVEKVENQIKSISVINASKLFLHRSGYASSKFKNNFHE